MQAILGQTDILRQAVKCLARDEPDEREEAVKLLFELSKSYALCEKIGATNGAILFLVGITSSNPENVPASLLAEQVLTNLLQCDTNVMQMAENGRLQPLLDRLTQGPWAPQPPLRHRHCVNQLIYCVNGMFQSAKIVAFKCSEL